MFAVTYNLCQVPDPSASSQFLGIIDLLISVSIKILENKTKDMCQSDYGCNLNQYVILSNLRDLQISKYYNLFSVNYVDT